MAFLAAPAPSSADCVPRLGHNASGAIELEPTHASIGELSGSLLKYEVTGSIDRQIERKTGHEQIPNALGFSTLRGACVG